MAGVDRELKRVQLTAIIGVISLVCTLGLLLTAFSDLLNGRTFGLQLLGAVVLAAIGLLNVNYAAKAMSKW